MQGSDPGVWGDRAGYRHSMACIGQGLDSMVHPNSSRSDLSLVYTYVQVEVVYEGTGLESGRFPFIFYSLPCLMHNLKSSTSPSLCAALPSSQSSGLDQGLYSWLYFVSFSILSFVKGPFGHFLIPAVF